MIGGGGDDVIIPPEPETSYEVGREALIASCLDLRAIHRGRSGRAHAPFWSRKVLTGPRPMAQHRSLALFDVDGTLTVPRKASKCLESVV